MMPLPTRGLILLLVAIFSSRCWAAPLETPFFRCEVPDGWTVHRNPSGLWQLTGPGLEPLQVAIGAARLSTTPELYLQGTATLWKSLGQVQPLQPWLSDRPDQAWFLVKHSPQPGVAPLATVKWVCWRDSLLVVTSFTLREAELQQLQGEIRSLASGLLLEKPKFQAERLQAEVDSVLREFIDDPEHLRDLDSAKLSMAVARQDWEPFFGTDTKEAQPPLYKAYLAYLEARYEASFAVVHGREMGIGPDLLDSRMNSVAVRRGELRRLVQGF
jgi:hypothetical protein